MADLKFENPKTTEGFAHYLGSLGVAVPVEWHPSELGVIRGADGDCLMTVDPLGDRDAGDVERITAMIVVAINTCCGLKAVAP